MAMTPNTRQSFVWTGKLREKEGSTHEAMEGRRGKNKRLAREERKERKENGKRRWGSVLKRLNLTCAPTSL